MCYILVGFDGAAASGATVSATTSGVDEEKKKEVTPTWVPLLDPVLSLSVPQHNIWYARAFHFNTDQVGGIFAQLRAR
jgi:hypothetical protein